MKLIMWFCVLALLAYGAVLLFGRFGLTLEQLLSGIALIRG